MFSCEGGFDFYAKDKCFAAFICIISDQTLAVKFSVQRDAVGWWFQENCQKKKIQNDDIFISKYTVWCKNIFKKVTFAHPISHRCFIRLSSSQ